MLIHPRIDGYEAVIRFDILKQLRAQVARMPRHQLSPGPIRLVRAQELSLPSWIDCVFPNVGELLGGHVTLRSCITSVFTRTEYLVSLFRMQGE